MKTCKHVVLALIFLVSLSLPSFAQSSPIDNGGLNGGGSLPHSGIGKCPAGQAAVQLLPNAPPICATFAGGGGINPGTMNDLGYYASSGSTISPNLDTVDSLGNMTVRAKLLVNNLQGTPGGADIEVTQDSNNDSLITLDTGGAGTNGGWGLQATDEGAGHFAEFELVSKLWEPFFCWGAGAGTFYNGTCGFQQPSTKEPLHLIRSTDVSPGGDMIDVESNGSGAEFWSIDAVGTEHFFGSSSGNISIAPQAASGTYNFNLPTSAGTSGYFLTSGGGGSAPMTWTAPPTGGSCSAGNIVTAVSASGVPTCTQKTDPFVCGTISAPANSQVLCDIPITKAETIPSSCTNSQAVSTVAATGTATFTINKISGGVTTAAGTVAWSGSGKTGAFTCSGSTSFAAGDMLQVVAPGTADATLAGLGITISMNAGAL